MLPFSMRTGLVVVLGVICSCASNDAPSDGPLLPAAGAAGAATTAGSGGATGGGGTNIAGGSAGGGTGAVGEGEAGAAGEAAAAGGSGGAGGVGGSPGGAGGVPAGGAPSDLSPAELLGGLEGWHLTLPTGDSNSATEVNQPELATYSDDYFQVAPGGKAVRMVALFGGARTSSRTAYARSELREEYAGADATDNDSWPCTEAVRSMHIQQAVMKTPLQKPEMSIGQIHDADNDLLEIRYIGPQNGDDIGTGDGVTDIGRIQAHFNNDTSSQLLDGAYHVGDVMILDVTTDGSGKMTVAYENVTRGTKKSATQAFYAKVSGGCYFKAGNYHQACSKKDINGATNQACVDKKWAAARYETDPQGTSVLDLFALRLK